jgi:predicted anti-sigma-YlaC factor YlaD
MSGIDPRCQAARVWISAAADDEATDAERTALQAHLAECAACRRWEALAGSLALRIRTAEPVGLSAPVPAPVEAFAPPVPMPALLARRHAARLRGVMAAVAVGAVASIAGVLVSAGTTGTAGRSASRTASVGQTLLVASRAQGFLDGVVGRGVVGLDRSQPPPVIGRNKLNPDDRAQQP